MTNPNVRADIQAANTGGKISGIAVVLVLTLIVVLVALAIYLTFPATGNHFWALVGIGILGLVVAIIAVFLSPASRDPAIARSASWGSYCFGVVVLLGAGFVAPDSIFTGNASDTGTFVAGQGLRIVYFILVLFVLVGGLLVMRWQMYNKASDIRREANRSAWRARTGVTTGSPSGGSPNDPRSNPPV